ncbi:hypothetical protein ACFQZV_08035 [Microbacterium koreense]|uniref:Uncharacterized protein n=1 Tax=Microbacterium koreense TaxID=323761 RepID=A0ABW2ZRH3_9MICO
MPTPFARLGAALSIAAIAALATACAGADPEPTATATAAPTVTEAAPEPVVTETVEPETPDPTCETIIPASTVEGFESIGWTVLADRFYLGELELADGIICTWADFEGPASDNLQRFGWAPITDEAAADAQTALVAAGWIREDGAAGVYITEDPETTISADEEGYGMTYLFADGAVTFADTKQGLLLIEWPN